MGIYYRRNATSAPPIDKRTCNLVSPVHVWFSSSLLLSCIRSHLLQLGGLTGQSTYQRVWHCFKRFIYKSSASQQVVSSTDVRWIDRSRPKNGHGYLLPVEENFCNSTSRLQLKEFLYRCARYPV